MYQNDFFKKAPISEQFIQYHHENPQVYILFKRYAEMALDRGFEKFSAKAIFERLRWHYNFETNNSDEWKLNNNYTAYYARKLMDEDPRFSDFFETRTRH